MHDDDKELIEILKNTPHTSRCHSKAVDECAPAICGGDSGPKREEQILRGLVQWTTSDGKTFIPASKTADKITPGVYEIQHSDTIGIYFQKIPVLAQGLLRFPQTNSERVVTEIQKFWERESLFREYKLTYKRGIILWGPPGSGKSCTIQLIMRDVVDRGGVVVKFTHPSLFTEGWKQLNRNLGKSRDTSRKILPNP